MKLLLTVASALAVLAFAEPDISLRGSRVLSDEDDFVAQETAFSNVVDKATNITNTATNVTGNVANTMNLEIDLPACPNFKDCREQATTHCKNKNLDPWYLGGKLTLNDSGCIVSCENENESSLICTNSKSSGPLTNRGNPLCEGKGCSGVGCVGDYCSGLGCIGFACSGAYCEGAFCSGLNCKGVGCSGFGCRGLYCDGIGTYQGAPKNTITFLAEQAN
ncbi:hypothetical protein TrLO_g15064 [Triparma laevis f. longispina]|uniref:Uncharacterized protein n=1 Tax=Triparma laevis f. longispina TaxID=1714387 RepID=A0A9W7FU07_9STRA|nr:hypothetical protein TrLO_g15064 [Triparma laevis f. longispina]